MRLDFPAIPKHRQTLSGWLLCAILILAVSHEALSQTRKGSGGRTGGNTGRAVAIINGQRIPWAAYEDLRNDQLSFQRRTGAQTEIDEVMQDTLLLQLVDAELLRQEAAKHHIVVTEGDAQRALLKDPPEFILPPFTDGKGVFHRDVFEHVVQQPESIVQLVKPTIPRDSMVAQWKHDLGKVIRFVQERETRAKLADALLKEKPLTEKAIRDHYFAERAIVTGSFVRVLHSTIPDSLIPISDAESRAWFAQHKEDYRAAPARYIATLLLPIDPTRTDTVLWIDRVDSAKKLLDATPAIRRADVVKSLQMGLPPSRFSETVPLSARLIPSELLEKLAKAQPGDVIGPIYRQGEAVLLYLGGTTPSRDTMVRARHILIRSQSDSASIVNARNMAAMLMDSVKQESNFKLGAKLYSQDASSAKEGDLGYFGRGDMTEPFDSAAFLAPVGQVVGPVRSKFGYHLIYVTDKITQAYKLHELRFPLEPSPSARQVVLREAQDYADAVRNEIKADSIQQALSKKYKAVLTDTAYVKRLERYGDVLATSDFAFTAQPGDVKVIPLPFDRVEVVKLMSTWPGGVPEYAQISNYAEAHARRAKQLAILKPAVDSLAKIITPEMLMGPIRSVTPMAEVFLITAQVPVAPPDEEPTILDSVVASTPNHSVSKPVRGKHGYYFLRVVDKTSPSETDYQRESANYRRDYTERYRQGLVSEVLSTARANAEFEDLRDESRSASSK